MMLEAGFEELSHTADLCLRVWAPTLERLFIEAALGMNALSGVQIHGDRREERHVQVTGDDDEQLLVGFLSELVLLADQENLAFDHIVVHIRGSQVAAELRGSLICSAGKSIKAVTYHNLKIQQTKRGFETEIVFDI